MALSIWRYGHRTVKAFAVIILLWHRGFVQNVDPVTPTNIASNGAFITLLGYVSNGPKLDRHTCQSMLHCSHLCLKSSKCVSFNYQLSKGINGLCELSERGIVSEEEREKLKKMPGFVFVQTVRQDLKPRSCLDYLNAGRRISGIYEIVDNIGSSYPVYCDLTSEPGAAWTLFMSERTPGSGLFVPLDVDNPTNEKTPNWNAFRLSLFKMKQLRSRSSHWRVTCSFQLDGLVLRDYARAKIANFDPIDFKEMGKCKKVEYINVRGHNCSDCCAAWWQGDELMLAHDSSQERCGFDPSSGAVLSEDNFGLYQNNNPNFRCTQPDRESTTNLWFGSHLEKRQLEDKECTI